MASELEQQRLANIASNQALLASLNLPTLSAAKPKPKKRATPAKRAKKEGSVDSLASSTPGVATRRSSRHSVVIQSDPVEAEKVLKRQREEEEADLLEQQLAKKARHEDRLLELVTKTGRSWKNEEELKKTVGDLKAAMVGIPAVKTEEDLVRYVKAELVEDDEGGRSTRTTPKKGKGRVTKTTTTMDPDVAALKEQIGQMVLRKVEKITPERVYSMLVHPTLDRDLVFMGDKSGSLGVADALAEEAEDDSDDDGETVKPKASWVIKAHARSSISCIRLNPNNPRILYTSGYDCTLRSIDFETHNSTEVVDADLMAAEEYGEGEALLSGFELTQDGNQMWISDNRGGVIHHDVRQKKTEAQRWQIALNKVGCISLNPVNENLLLTAHLNRDMRVYDVRKLSSLSTDTDREDIDANSLMAEYTHGRACSAAYFDPSGQHILSTSYDDKMCLWDINASTFESVESFEPTRTVKHDNQTGRYVSVFKAQWSPNPSVVSHWTCGSMKRALEIYAYDGTLITSLYDPSLITAVPAVTASHPRRVDRAYGGNGSGKLTAWAPAEVDEAEVQEESDVKQEEA